MAEFVAVDVVDGVGTILLQRPPMNALNRQMQDEIRDAADELGARADVGAVIVYGGPKVFAAGADIKEMADMSYQDMLLASTLTVAYVAILTFTPIGFMWATIAYIGALGWTMSDRTPRHNLIAAVTAVVAGVGITLLFTKIFVLDLP